MNCDETIFVQRPSSLGRFRWMRYVAIGEGKLEKSLRNQRERKSRIILIKFDAHSICIRINCFEIEIERSPSAIQRRDSR